MKTKSYFFTVLFALSAFAFLSGCSGDKKDAAESHDHGAHEQATAKDELAQPSEPQFQVDEKFQDQLASVFTSYVELKEAFVSSDVKQVQTEAAQTTESLNGVDMKLVTGAAHNDWMTYP
jgi:hypothetical protein